jgi:hypothetical protein
VESRRDLFGWPTGQVLGSGRAPPFGTVPARSSRRPSLRIGPSKVYETLVSIARIEA